MKSIIIMFFASIFFSQLTFSKALVLVNHDLYSHTYQSLVRGQSKALPPVGLEHSQVISLLDEARKDVLLANEIEFNLNMVYGSHLLSYWDLDKSYKEWLCSIVGTRYCHQRTTGNGIDNLIKGKLENKNILEEFLKADVTQNSQTNISIRMSDHHHIEHAREYLKSLPLIKTNQIRSASALSPSFMRFLTSKWVLHGGSSAGKLGRKGAGTICDQKSKYYFLDFSRSQIIDFKINQIKSIMNNQEVNGIELDFSRTPCFFPASSTLKQKQDAMNRLIESIYDYARHIYSQSQRQIRIYLRIPIDIDTTVTGLNLNIIAAKQQIDGLIIARTHPYNSPNWDLPGSLRGSKKGKIKVYAELYHIADQIGKIRRVATSNELLTSAHEVMNFGFDGVSLFNLQYLFLENPKVPHYTKFHWDQILPCMTQKTCLNNIKRTYFFSRKNALGSKLSVGPSSGYIKVKMKNPHTAKTNRKRFYLRLQAENEKDIRDWRSMEIEVLVNGKKHRLTTSTKIPGLDPSNNYPMTHNGSDYWRPWRNRISSKHRFIPISHLRNGMNIIRVYAKNSKRTIPFRASLIFD